MGRIKTKLIKRTTKEIIARHRGNFGTDYMENKQSLRKVASIKSKKLRNIISGYLTRLKKAEKQ